MITVIIALAALLAVTAAIGICAIAAFFFFQLSEAFNSNKREPLAPQIRLPTQNHFGFFLGTNLFACSGTSVHRLCSSDSNETSRTMSV